MGKPKCADCDEPVEVIARCILCARARIVARSQTRDELESTPIGLSFNRASHQAVLELRRRGHPSQLPTAPDTPRDLEQLQATLDQGSPFDG